MKPTIVFAFVALLLAACAPAAQPTVQAPPAPRLPGLSESQYVTLQGERVYYEVGGQGSPVVLVHGIGAGNSSHLYRNNTAALAKQHRVYAFDWPGFARSGARARQYTNDLYVAILEDFLRTVVKAPAALVGGSLGSDYSIRVAAEQPALVSKLLLSNPAGYDINEAENKEGRAFLTTTTRRNEGLYNQFANTILGDLIFGTLKSDAGIDFFLYNYVYLDWRRVTPELTKIYLTNLDGPNKQYAPFSFFAGFLEQRIAEFWPKTKQPTLLVWGSDDIFTPIRFAQPLLKAREVPFKILKARAIPYDEDFEAFNALALEFLR